MSQPQYSAVSQGPATIPMDNYNQQRRITPAPVGWCTPRRTKVIIAIVLMSLLWVVIVVVWSVVKTAATKSAYDQLTEELNKFSSQNYNN